MMNWIKKFLGKEEPEIVLWAQTDNMYPQYSVKVVRTAPNTGKLTVFFNGKVIGTKMVGVAYDAKFGVDFSDLEAWAILAVAISDDHARTQN